MTKTQNTHFRLARSELISRSCFLFSLFLTFPFINGVFSLIQLLVVDLRRRLKGRENNSLVQQHGRRGSLHLTFTQLITMNVFEWNSQLGYKSLKVGVMMRRNQLQVIVD